LRWCKEKSCTGAGNVLREVTTNAPSVGVGL
jgi:hypothetical protein